MKVYAIHDLTNSKVLELLEAGLESVTESHILKNYHPSYKNNAANLFYILENGRYKIGKYFIITDDLDNYGFETYCEWMFDIMSLESPRYAAELWKSDRFWTKKWQLEQRQRQREKLFCYLEKLCPST